MARQAKDLIRLIRPAVRQLKPYHVDETPVRLKLDAMENPFTLPEELRAEIGLSCQTALINRYPDPSAKELKRKIAEYWGMDPASMMLGNGSDELIQAVILAFGGPIITPAPSFAMYEITARALSKDVFTLPLCNDFSLDADRLIKLAKEKRARVVFLALPNNPTGNRFSDDEVRKILEETNAAVVIDEAYYSFSGKTWLSALKDHPNIIILRTLSKIGFAGLRIGVLTASIKVVEELNKIRLPYNINVLSQAAAVVALSHTSVLEHQISELISERQRLYNALNRIPGVIAYPSETNFILLRTEKDASAIHDSLKQAGILVKNLNRPGLLKNCLRVTVGRPEENDEFIKQMQEILATNGRR